MSVLLTMDNFPGSLEWPPVDEPGVLGRAPVLSLSPSSSALLSGANTRCLPIPCGGQDHRGGLGPDRQSGSTTLSLQPGKLCVGPDTGGREPLEGNHWVGAPHCPSPIALGSFVSARDLWGKPLLWIARGHVEWEGYGVVYMDKAQQEGREKGGHSLPRGRLRQEVILWPLVLKRVSVMVVIPNTTGTGWGPDVIAPIGSCNDSVKPMIFLLVVKVQVIFCSFVCFSDLKSKFHPRR